MWFPFLTTYKNCKDHTVKNKHYSIVTKNTVITVSGYGPMSIPWNTAHLQCTTLCLWAWMCCWGVCVCVCVYACCRKKGEEGSKLVISVFTSKPTDVPLRKSFNLSHASVDSRGLTVHTEHVNICLCLAEHIQHLNSTVVHDSRHYWQVGQNFSRVQIGKKMKN